MGMCYVDTCMNNATKQCSGCSTATYCSEGCQKAHWSTHKRECKMQRQFHDIQQRVEAEERQKPPVQYRKTHCTGCNAKFGGRDEIEVDQECPNCGYITCESCSCSNSRGSCDCQDSNFGHSPYCTQEPRDYHRGKFGYYKGDYHPSKSRGYEWNREDHPEAFEEEARACNSCGEVTYMLKKEYS